MSMMQIQRYPANGQLARDLEHWETPEWAAQAILRHELLTTKVLDPCCGFGILSEAAKLAGYDVEANDIYDWGYEGQQHIVDFLSDSGNMKIEGEFSVFMNPPFSKAQDFVEKSLELGARKIVCFQRFAWWESDTRREFWDRIPPSRVYICGNRATCWLASIPKEDRRNGTAVAHAWFVWERGHPRGTSLGSIWKEDKK